MPPHPVMGLDLSQCDAFCHPLDSCWVFALWHWRHMDCRLSGESVPPSALFTMWSTSVAGVIKPYLAHGWHRCLSRLRTIALSLRQVAPYPRLCALPLSSLTHPLDCFTWCSQYPEPSLLRCLHAGALHGLGARVATSPTYQLKVRKVQKPVIPRLVVIIPVPAPSQPVGDFPIAP